MSELTSENGWPVLVRDQLHWFTAAGERFAAANADVAYVAAYLIDHFNTVEPLDGPVHDDWSWATRPVTGQTSGFSNHASATGWDLNALRHPRGVHGTFTPEQVAAVRKILAKITDNEGRRIFRWGNDYKVSPVDAMHFEIDASPEQVRQARAKLETDQKPQENEMPLTAADADLIAKRLLAATVELTDASAAAMSLDEHRRSGDKVSLSYIWQWGGAGLFKALAEIRALEAREATLSAALAAAALAQATRDDEEAKRTSALRADISKLTGALTDALAVITALKAAG